MSRTPPQEQPLTEEESKVQRCGEIGLGTIAEMLRRFGLDLACTDDGTAIPGSYWGPPEAGLLGTTVWVRRDTPVHSLLHEACHAICMDEERRRHLDTEAAPNVPEAESTAEENAVCYLQVLLADHLPGVGRERLMLDMDRWGYSFRLGSTRAWFDRDAGEASAWLIAHDLIDQDAQVLWNVRSSRA